MIRASLRLAVLLLTLLSLFSCSPRLTLLVSPEASGVGDLVLKEAGGTKGLSGLTVLPDTAPWPVNGPVARLTSTPGWNLPQGSPQSSPIPASALPSGFAPIPVFAAMGQAKDGSWSALPLFFDAVGVEAYYESGSNEAPQLPTWAELADKRWVGRVTLPGRLPLYREAAFFLSEATPGAQPDMGNWFNQGAGPWQGGLARVSDWTASPAWAPSTWQFAPGDLAVWREAGSSYVFGTTYREFGLSRAALPRRFALWQRQYGSGQTALAGPILFLEVFGKQAQTKDMEPLYSLLCSPEFQIRVGVRLKWMGVNQNSAEIDGDSASVRAAARDALRFFPLTDRLPATIPSDNLMGAIQAAVNFAKKR